MDPDFLIHRAVGQVWAEVARKMSDSVILPINCRLYAKFVADKRDLLIQEYGAAMTEKGIDLSE